MSVLRFFMDKLVILFNLFLSIKKDSSDLLSKINTIPCFGLIYKKKTEFSKIIECMNFIRNNISQPEIKKYIEKSFNYEFSFLKTGELSNNFKNRILSLFNDSAYPDDEFENFYYYIIYKKCYSFYVNSETVLSESDVVSIYSQFGIDIKNDTELKKNGLITFNRNFNSLYLDKYNKQLLDSRLKDMRFCIDIDTDIGRELEKLFKQNLIKKMSFRPIRKIGDYFIACEEFQTGKYFDLNFANLNKCKINLFYPLTDGVAFYDKKLFIKVECSSITFEEICDFNDAKVDDDLYETKLIHFRLLSLEEKYFINHFDYENIYYTKEQYSSKFNNPCLKGSKKIKLFKVDNAKIPLNHMVNINLENQSKGALFIYLIVHNTFQYKSLVDEYFSKVINSNL